jgi:hypothetical protein
VPWCAFCPPTSPSNSTASTTASTLHAYSHCDDVDDILDTFPIVNRTDGQRDGEYRTKQLILDIYNGIDTAIETVQSHQIVLTPPAGEGPRHSDWLA